MPQKEEMPPPLATRNYCTWPSSQSLGIYHLHHEGLKQQSQHEQICLIGTITIQVGHDAVISLKKNGNHPLLWTFIKKNTWKCRKEQSEQRLLYGGTLILQSPNVLFPRIEEQKLNMCKIQQHTCRQLWVSVWKKESSTLGMDLVGRKQSSKEEKRPAFLLYHLIRPDLITRAYPKVSGVLKPLLIVCYGQWKQFSRKKINKLPCWFLEFIDFLSTIICFSKLVMPLSKYKFSS